MATRSVAIDVGSTMLRVAEVELKGGGDPRDGATLTTYAERPMPAGIIREGRVEEPGAFRSVLKELLSAAKITAKHCTLAVGQPAVMVREVDVPSQPMDKVRDSLAFHVQEDLPMAVDEAILDFYPTHEFDGPSGATLRGLLVAAPKDLVRDLVTAFDGSGVGVTRIDHSAFGVWRSTVRADLMADNVAVVNIGSANTTVVVSQQGMPRLVRVLPQGGADATRAVASAFKGASIDAEQLKLEVGMATGGAQEHRAVADAVAHAMEPLIESVRNTLVYFASSNPGGAVSRLVLTGGGSYLYGFGQAIASSTRLPVRIGDPLSGLAFGKRVERTRLQGREATASNVIGLALGGAL